MLYILAIKAIEKKIIFHEAFSRKITTLCGMNVFPRVIKGYPKLFNVLTSWYKILIININIVILMCLH